MSILTGLRTWLEELKTQHVIGDARQVDYNMYVTNQLMGDDPTTLDKINSTFQKIQKIIEVAKTIWTIISSLLPLFAATMTYDINSNDPTEVLLAMNEAIEGNGYTLNIYSKDEIDAMFQGYSPDLTNYYTKTQIDNTCMMKNRIEVATNEIHIGNADSTFTGNMVSVDHIELKTKYITDFEEGAQTTANTTIAVSKQYCDETYQPLTTMANYLTTSAAATTYQTKTDAATDYSTLASALTAQGISISQCLTTSDAASTYQPLSGMSNYLTTTDAASTYLTAADAASTYQTITDANTDYGALSNAITDLGHNVITTSSVTISSTHKLFFGSVNISYKYYANDNTFHSAAVSLDMCSVIIGYSKASFNLGNISFPDMGDQHSTSKVIELDKIELVTSGYPSYRVLTGKGYSGTAYHTTSNMANVFLLRDMGWNTYRFYYVNNVNGSLDDNFTLGTWIFQFNNLVLQASSS